MEKDLIEYIAKSLVSDENAVVVNEIENEHSATLQLSVAEADIGKVIGRNGRIAYAMRTILGAVVNNSHYELDIVG